MRHSVFWGKSIYLDHTSIFGPDIVNDFLLGYFTVNSVDEQFCTSLASSQGRTFGSPNNGYQLSAAWEGVLGCHSWLNSQLVVRLRLLS
jgi:hypothetical protein